MPDPAGAVPPMRGGAIAGELLGGLSMAADPAGALEQAGRLLADGDAIVRLLDPAIAALAADPLHEPPFRVSRDRVRQGAVLYDAPHVRMTASVLSARAIAAPASVVLPGHVAVTRYHRAGGARIRRWRMRDDRLVETAPLTPADGEVATHDGRHEAQAVVGAERDMVTVTIVLRDTAPPLVREFDAADGRLLRCAASDDVSSRRLLLLTLLRAMRRSDSGEVFAEATRADAYHARWSAMREWLALDARAALPRLADMAANDPDDDVRRAAIRTLARCRA